MRKSSAEEKLLRQIAKSMMTDKKYPVRQEMPACPRCRLAIDITDVSIKIDFRDMDVSGKMLIVAEPYCPGCGKRVEAIINTLN